MEYPARTITKFIMVASWIIGFTTLSINTSAQENSGTPACSFQDLKFQAFSSAATGINDIGAVVGSFSVGLRTGDQAFLLFQGKFTPFTFPGSFSTGAADINNHAQIVGSYFGRDAMQHGFLVRSGGFKTIDVPGAAATFANGINNTGDIVGSFVDSSGAQRSFLLHQGKFTFFRFPGSVFTQANSINKKSVIVGVYANSLVGARIHGFRVKNGAFATFDFPGALNTFPAKVNDLGEIVGSYQNSDGFIAHGFVFAHGKFTTIDKPPEAAETRTNILGVNNRSQIVGGFSDVNIFAALAFQGNCKAVF